MVRESSLERNSIPASGARRIWAAVSFVLITAFSTPAIAGPAIPDAAKPGFSDPLAGVRPADAVDRNVVVSAENLQAREPAGGATDGAVPFTIIDDAGGALTQAVPNDLREAVGNRFLGASPTTNDDAAAAAGATPAVPLTVGAIARGLVNSLPAQRGGGGGNARVDDGRSGGEVRSFIDETIAQLIVDILNPEVTTEGLITFSIAGFGSFALILSEESGSVFLVDLDRGTAVKILDHEVTQADFDRNSAATGKGSQQFQSSNALQRILDFLERNVFPVLTSPITLVAGALFAIIWLVWRLSASRAT